MYQSYVLMSRHSDGHHVLASASSAGHIALWDLNEGGRLLHMIRGAHDAAITGVEWVPGQPVLITSSEDNSVKVRFWTQDSGLHVLTSILLAMVVRVTDLSSQTAEIPLRTPLTATSNSLLRGRRQAATYRLPRSQSSLHVCCTRLKIL